MCFARSETYRGAVVLDAAGGVVQRRQSQPDLVVQVLGGLRDASGADFALVLLLHLWRWELGVKSLLVLSAAQLFNIARPVGDISNQLFPKRLLVKTKNMRTKFADEISLVACQLLVTGLCARAWCLEAFSGLCLAPCGPFHGNAGISAKVNSYKSEKQNTSGKTNL